MSTLRFFKNYNNYENRIIKHDTAISDYSTYTYYDMNGVNFNPNDSLYTEQVASNTTAWKPDYMLELNDKKDTIISRWFVIGHNRTLTGQYKYRLKRDIIADKYDNVVNAPIYIERAMINSKNNPLLYNYEGFTFNEIKQQEILLKDKSNTPWYVCYFKDIPDSDNNHGSFTLSNNYDISIPGSLASSIYAPGTKYYINNLSVATNWRVSSNSNIQLETRVSENAISFNQVDHILSYNRTYLFTDNVNLITQTFRSIFYNQYSNLKTKALTDIGYSTITDSQYQALNDVSNQNIKVYSVADGKIYNVRATITLSNEETVFSASDETTTYVRGLVSATELHNTTTPLEYGTNPCDTQYTLATITVVASEMTTGSCNWAVYSSSETPTLDSQYNIIAVPYYDITFIDGTSKTAKKEYSEALIKSMVNQLSQSYIVDVQLLPYCPIQRALDSSGRIVKSNLLANEINIIYPTGITTYGTFILYLSSSSFTFNISQSITVPNDVIDTKVDNETKLYKIVSPNYNGSFEFSPVKNFGVDNFNVDVSLIPYTPYIHVNPNFKGLYGADYNDSKGLICGGDFSLPLRVDQWEQYQINNKNYQNIFDRQMKNLDFNQRQETIGQVVSSITGTIQGGTQGAMAGGMAGGAYGAIAGGVLGTTASAIGGLFDYTLMKQRQREAKSFSTDMYKYQLGNIQALPDNITKVSPFTFNNKLWPFIEVYDATDEEKTLFRNFLTYKSMSINAIGYINYYLQASKTFIKGKIIRIEDAEIDADMLMEIYNELDKGVYI